MIAVKEKQLPNELRTYIGKLTSPLILEVKGKPYISIEPEKDDADGTETFLEIDKIISKSKPVNFEYKDTLQSVLEEKYENIH